MEDDDERPTEELHETPQPSRGALGEEMDALAHLWAGGVVWTTSEHDARRKEEEEE